MNMSIITPEQDPLARDFGPLTKEALRLVEALLKVFMKEIGELVESHPCDHACGSCGLSPKTCFKPKEFLPTAYGLVWAITKGKLFVCHGNQPEWAIGSRIDTDRLRLCGNLEAIKTLPEKTLSRLAHMTMSEISAVAREES